MTVTEVLNKYEDLVDNSLFSCYNNIPENNLLNQENLNPNLMLLDDFEFMDLKLNMLRNKYSSIKDIVLEEEEKQRQIYYNIFDDEFLKSSDSDGLLLDIYS